MTARRLAARRCVAVLAAASLLGGAAPAAADDGTDPAGGAAGVLRPSACVAAAEQEAGFADRGEFSSEGAVASAVDCLAHYGATVGYGDGSFRSDAPARLSHVALFMARTAAAAGVDLTPGSGSGALRLPTGRAAVEALIAAGIIDGGSSGSDDGSSGSVEPGSPVTWRDLLVWTHRFLAAAVVGPGGVKVKDPPADAADGGFEVALEALAALGVVPSGGVDPDAVVSRGDVAVAFAAALGNTNARPAGVSVQLVRTASGRVEAVVSVRDDNQQVPKGPVFVDVFRVPGRGEGAFDDEGRCAAITSVFGDSVPCRISSRNRVDANGNLAGFTVRGFGSVIAWAGSPGQEYVHNPTDNPNSDGTGGSGGSGGSGAVSVSTTEVRTLAPGAEPLAPPTTTTTVPRVTAPILRPPTTTAPCASPAVPATVTATGGLGSIQVNWTPASGGCPFDGFVVQYKKVSDANWAEATKAAADRSHTITPLDATNYQVQVIAVNGANRSAAKAAAAAVTVGTCTAPSVTLTQTDGGFDVSWTQTDAGACADAGFVVEHKLSTAQNYSSTNKVATARSHSFTGLNLGATYNVRVTANSNAHGNKTSTVATKTVIGAPAAPTVLTVAASGHNQITASWTAAASTTNKPVNNQVLRWKLTTANTYTTVELGATAATHTLTGLAAGSSYHVNVGAKNSVGTTYASTTDTQTKACDVKNVSGLSVSSSASGQFVASWTLPTVTCALTKIVLEYKKTSGSWDTAADVTSVDKASTDTTHTQTSLDNVSYDVRIKTVNNASLDSTYTDTAQVSVGEPLKVWWNHDSPRPQWNPVTTPDKVRVFMRVNVSKQASALCRVNSTTTISCPPGTYVSLTGGPTIGIANWNIEVTATAGTETASTIVIPYSMGGPGAPEIVLSAGNGKIGVGWSVPATVPPESAIIGYNLEYRTSGTTSWTAALGDSNNAFYYEDTNYRGHTLTLANDTTYEIRVRARGTKGTLPGTKEDFPGMAGTCLHDEANTDPSKRMTIWCNATPAATKIGNPGAPTSTSVAVGDDQLTVNWSAPTTNTSNPTVHAYRIRFKTTADGATYSAHTVWGKATSHTITGLEHNTAYIVEIRAENANGDSGWSVIGTTHTTT